MNRKTRGFHTPGIFIVKKQNKGLTEKAFGHRSLFVMILLNASLIGILALA